MKKLGAYCTLGALGLAALLWFVDRSLQRTDGAGQVDKLAQGAGREGVSRLSGLSPTPEQVSERREELRELLRRWEAEIQASKDGRGTPGSPLALAEETAGLLLCSAEMVELLEFLGNHRGGQFRRLVEGQVLALLRSDRAGEARLSLIGLEENRYRELWSMEGGRFCSDEEFDDFREALGSGASAQTALLGRNLGIVSDDPGTAITSTLAELRSEVHSRYRGDILQQLMAGLPDDADFAEIETLLPPKAGKLQYQVDSARKSLIAKWGSSDPAAAANYVLDHPDRIEPAVMGSAVEGYLLTDLAAAVEWIQDLPDGAYLDAAVGVAIQYIAEGYPEEARQLAGRIEDPKVRASHLEFIEGFKEADRAILEEHTKMLEKKARENGE